MPIPAVPPQGDAQLNDNARTVIGKRYLIKDATGTPVEQPEDIPKGSAAGDRVLVRTPKSCFQIVFRASQA